MDKYQFEQLLVLMQEVGCQLLRQEGAYYRVWGRHLEQDVLSLRIIGQKLDEPGETQDRSESGLVQSETV